MENQRVATQLQNGPGERSEYVTKSSSPQITQLEDTEVGSPSSAQQSNPIPVMVNSKVLTILTSRDTIEVMLETHLLYYWAQRYLGPCRAGV